MVAIRAKNPKDRHGVFVMKLKELPPGSPEAKRRDELLAIMRDETRSEEERIKTSMLINRLTNHALGKVKLEASQVRAIEVLLRKSLPDLQAVELSGGLGVKTHEEALSELE
jgi:hypothetical protein